MIGLVSESLKSLLEGQMSPSAKVTLLSPSDESPHSVRVNLFLYRVVPNAYLRNRESAAVPGVPGSVAAPSLFLDLFYLLTVYAPLDQETGQADVHAVLGEAMRVLHENSRLPDEHLEDGLPSGLVKVTLHSTDVEELSKIWTALNKDYRLSVAYEVSVVEVAARAERPVARRVERTDIRVDTDRRPTLAAVAPRSGPAGTVVRVSGTGLAGWRATVLVGGRPASPASAIEHDDGFDVTVPSGLGRGVFEVEVDVAGLARHRDAFEVTA